MKRLRHTAQVNGEGSLALIPPEVGKACSNASPLISQSPILPLLLLGTLLSRRAKLVSLSWGVWWLSPKKAGA